ncbi:MAG: hypothetical protein KFF46_00835 [Desulfobacterales bacterium]|nr:hypothetical protein [Desulfobacterales bacterium]
MPENRAYYEPMGKKQQQRHSDNARINDEMTDKSRYDTLAALNNDSQNKV